MTIIRNGLLAAALTALTAGIAASAAAAPLPSSAAELKAAAPSYAMEVKHEDHRADRRRVAAPRYYRPQSGYSGYGGPHYGGPDTVGSLIYGPDGYAYNRFGGQRYQSCVFDEGYGRTRPCDAGRW